MRKLNATTVRATKCHRCGRVIAKGVRVSVFRERALSYREAMHRGTMYPKRLWCADCTLNPPEPLHA